MKLAIFAVAMILMAGIFHVIFIWYDYLFNDPNEGAFRIIQDRFNETLDPYYRGFVNNQSNMLREFFGIARVACIGMVIVAFIVVAVRKPRIDD